MKTFEKLGIMTDENMDIRLAPLENIISIDIRGMNGQITIGVPRAVAEDLMGDREFIGGFLIADKRQFDAIEER